MTRVLADATGRTDEELNLGLAMAVAAAGTIAALRLLNWLVDLDIIRVRGHPKGGSDRNVVSRLQRHRNDPG